MNIYIYIYIYTYTMYIPGGLQVRLRATFCSQGDGHAKHGHAKGLAKSQRSVTSCPDVRAGWYLASGTLLVDGLTNHLEYIYVYVYIHIYIHIYMYVAISHVLPGRLVPRGLVSGMLLVDGRGHVMPTCFGVAYTSFIFSSSLLLSA